MFLAQEKQLEYAVIDILERANATDYMSTFARHRITIETLCQMSEEDFKQVRMIGHAQLYIHFSDGHVFSLGDPKAQSPMVVSGSHVMGASNYGKNFYKT